MIIVYGQQTGWEPSGVNVFGHCAVVLTEYCTKIRNSPEKGIFLSYATEAKPAPGYPAHALDHIALGFWGAPVHRVELPTQEDDCGSKLSEEYAYEAFKRYGLNNNFNDCINLVARVLSWAQRYHVYSGKPAFLPTPAACVKWAGNIQGALLNSRHVTCWPNVSDRSILVNDALRDDPTRNRIPWSKSNNRRKIAAYKACTGKQMATIRVNATQPKQSPPLPDPL